MAATLLRNHLGRALVGDVSSGYFNKAVVARLAQPLDFRRMNGESEYRQVIAKHYETSRRAWLTPVEIFQPHYAEAIGDSMLRRHRDTFGADEPLRICEVGGGTGTAAISLLHWLRRTSPRDYERCSYVLLEPSALLAQVQTKRLRDEGLDQERARVVHAPMSGWRETLGGSQHGGWSLLFLEVLDNLPHDKLRHDMEAGVLLEAHVVQERSSPHVDSGKGHGTHWREEFRPLTDPTLIRVAELLDLDSPEGLHAFEAALLPGAGSGWLSGLQQGLLSLTQDGGHSSRSRDVYVPTGSYLLLSELCGLFPEHHITLADFSHWGPDSSSVSNAVNAPVVQSQHNGATRDWRGDYLAAPLGEADIMFATSSDALARLYAHASQNHQPTISLSTAEFMQRHADVRACATASGYNPLLQDFVNTSLFLTTTKAGARGGTHDVWSAQRP
jgi:hypothetical protein